MGIASKTFENEFIEAAHKHEFKRKLEVTFYS